MPALQWLGTLPTDNKYGGIAEAISGGTESYLKYKQAGQENQLELNKIDYGKKKDAADIILKMMENATPEQIDKMIGDNAENPQIKELLNETLGPSVLQALKASGGNKVNEGYTENVGKYKDLAAKEGYNLKVAKKSYETTPSGQTKLTGKFSNKEQLDVARKLFAGAKRADKFRTKLLTQSDKDKKGSLRSSILRNTVQLPSQMGGKVDFEVKNKEDIMTAIERSGYDPTETYWQDTLKKFDVVYVKGPDGIISRAPALKLPELVAAGYEEVIGEVD